MIRNVPMVFAVALVSCGFTLAAVSPATPDLRPRLEVVRGEDGINRISVTTPGPGATQTTKLLRETAAAVSVGATGLDPEHRASFVTWDEAGERWFSITRDGGQSWWDSRGTATNIMLRDGQPAVGRAMPAARFGYELPVDGKLFLVQLRTVSIPEWVEGLQAQGAEVLSFLPYNTYIVRVDRAQLPKLAALDFVERVEPYQPWYRVSPEVRAWLDAPGVSEEAKRMRVVALEWGDTGKSRIAETARALGAEIVEWYPSGYIIEINLTRNQLRALAGHNDVAWIDPWTPKENDMDITRQDSGANWAETNYGYCGTGVRGEVLDAGFETTHQDFDGILLHGAVNVDSHGTSTYGMVFGNGARDGDGDAKATSHLPCAQGIAADYDNLGDRFAHTQQLKQAPYFASFQSNSWGDARNRSYDSVSQQMDDIIWRLDFAIAQSQSNAGNQDSRPQAWAKNILSVGAVNHYDTPTTADDCWCSGASIGPAEDGRIKPDISYWYDDIYTTTTGNGYTSGFNGTSAATPATAGVMGLIVQMYADNVWGTNPVGATVFDRQPHASTLKALMINSANQYPFSGTNSDLTRVHQGWGRANMRNAKERAAQSFIIDESVVLKVNDKVSYDIDVHSGEAELKVTLNYNDNPGTTSASMHRINDLDLTVTSPSGTIYRGNFGLDAGNYSLPNGTRDNKNNVENVFVQNPAAGLWKVEIEAREVNQDQYLATPQTDIVFALVTTGGTGSVCVAPTADFSATPNPARVGQNVLFDSTVSGGDGGPYTYQWDVNSDGTIDSVVADPTLVYNRPYNGIAKLTTRDGVSCPKNVDKNIVVNGPDIRVNDYVNLTQVQGNNNGAVDPGEIWDLTVRLKNIGNETALNVSASVRPSTGNAGAVGMVISNSLFADMPVNFVASGTAIRFQVGQNFPCGNDILFDVFNIRSIDPSNTYPVEIGKLRVLVGGAGAPQQFFADSFETNLGWTFAGTAEWEQRNPLGKGGGNTIPGQPKPQPDPTTAFAGTKVMGNDLTGTGPSIGNYESNQDAIATSPAINCSDAVAVSLQFARWLNVLPQDIASVEVSNNGTTWTTIYSVSDGIDATSWTLVSYDVSAIADRSPNFRVRFRLISNQVVNGAGWTVDDLRLFGVTRNSCQPVTRANPGSTKNLTITKSGGALALTWATDCGGTSHYSVYRGNLSLGYSSIAPEPGQCDVTSTSVTVPQGAGTGDFFLIVPNDGGFEGSYGSQSNGTARAPAALACHARDTVNSCIP